MFLTDVQTHLINLAEGKLKAEIALEKGMYFVCYMYEGPFYHLSGENIVVKLLRITETIKLLLTDPLKHACVKEEVQLGQWSVLKI